MIFYCVIFCYQKGLFPAELRPFKQFPTGISCLHTLLNLMQYDTHIYMCVGGGREKKENARNLI